MDGLSPRGQVYVIGTTNKLNAIDQALRRPGRFDKEIIIKTPTAIERYELFKIFLGSTPAQINIQNWTAKTHGLVHADIKMMVNEAKLNVIDRCNRDPLVKIVLLQVDMEAGFKSVSNSLLRKYASFKDQNVFLKDIIGHQNVKEILLRELTYPFRYGQYYKKFDVKPLKGVIFYGAPGCGKTHFAKALSNQLQYNFINVNASQLVDKLVGQTEKNIAELFQRANYASPCIIYIDEIDSLLGDRQSISGEREYQKSKIGAFLSHMDGISTSKDPVLVIGTTNSHKSLDKALLRAGRFELMLEFLVPNKEELRGLFSYYFPFLPEDFNWNPLILLASQNKFTGADISALKRIAVMRSIAKGLGTRTEDYLSIIDPIFLEDCINQHINRKQSTNLQDKKQKETGT